MLNRDQSQTAADGALAIQAGGNVTVNGLSYADARQISLDVFTSNYLKLSEEAANVALNRAKQLVDEFLQKVAAENPKALNQANDPGFQHAVYTAQKEHACVGDKDLGDLLVNLLVDRTREAKRTLRQVALDQALATAGKLTTSQLAALSAIFYIKYVKVVGIDSLGDLGFSWDRWLQPLVDIVTGSRGDIQHLTYAGCGSLLVSRPLSDAFLEFYPTLFNNGFSATEWSTLSDTTLALKDAIFVISPWDASRFQVRASSVDALEKRLQTIQIPDRDIARIRQLEKDSRMKTEEAEKAIVATRSYMGTLIPKWTSSGMGAMQLSSVGIALAHANLQRLHPEIPFGELSIWLN